MVKDPIRPITYDIVSNPSHTTARVLEFLPETAREFIPESSNLIYEGEFLESLNKDHIMISEGDSIVIRFIDDIINERFRNVVSKNIKFKIY